MKYVKTLFWSSVIGLGVVLAFLALTPTKAVCYTCTVAKCVDNGFCGPLCHCVHGSHDPHKFGVCRPTVRQ